MIFRSLLELIHINIAMIKQTIHDVYVEKQQQERILEEANAHSVSEKEKVSEELETAMESPIFSIQLNRFRGSDTFVYDSTFQFLFGFYLVFCHLYSCL